jgi:predicted RNA binding protein YcfA (HicA-like mRNA interferase family)
MAVETNRAKVVAQLEREGWELARHGANHDVYSHPRMSGVIVVPRHRTLSTGVAHKIAKIAGWA